MNSEPFVDVGAQEVEVLAVALVLVLLLVVTGAALVGVGDGVGEHERDLRPLHGQRRVLQDLSGVVVGGKSA